MVATTSLSVAANELRNLLEEGRGITGLKVDQIKIGHPKDTFHDMKKDKNHLNLFFYNVKYDGYPADGLSVDPFYVRLHCLITAVGAKKGNPSPGENDLRLIGEVMRVLHENPTVSIKDKNHHMIAQLEIVPQPMDLEHLNHIWSTQGDTAYRLSVAYELALAPVPMTEAAERSLLVGETGTRAQGDMDVEPLPADGFGIETAAPVVPKVAVDVKKPGWAPHICFVYGTSNTLHYTLLIPAPQLPLSLKVLIAGKAHASVTLVWERWNPSGGGWERPGVSQNENIGADTIDPENFDPAMAADVDLPLSGKGQTALYAERAWVRPDGSTVTLRSNPLLVTVYEVTP